MDEGKLLELNHLLSQYEDLKKETNNAINLIYMTFENERRDRIPVDEQWNTLVDRDRLAQRSRPSIGQLDEICKEIKMLNDLTSKTRVKYHSLFSKLLGGDDRDVEVRKAVNISSLLYYDFVRQPSTDSPLAHVETVVPNSNEVKIPPSIHEPISQNIEDSVQNNNITFQTVDEVSLSEGEGDGRPEEAFDRL